ncbi:MAG TPA: TonB-dependent receptor plug domain-containing protein, partial [Puia sp.]
MRLPKRLLWTASLVLAMTGVFAQSKNIRGRVTDSQTGNPLSSVTVSLKNSTNRVATDPDGNFSIKPDGPGEMILECTIVGYATQQIKVSGNEFVRVSMQPEASGLNEVVVVGYGTQKRANLTGAVGTVKADALKDRSITNASQALAGQIPGLWVNQTSGQPGLDGATINIRGIGTLGNSTPLVLIDGIQGSFNGVNPNDIESISVLKDASSSAIYGSRAANGVILIVTKSGKKGPLHVDLNSY